jgi:hypothetical protein
MLTVCVEIQNVSLIRWFAGGQKKEEYLAISANRKANRDFTPQVQGGNLVSLIGEIILR